MTVGIKNSISRLKHHIGCHCWRIQQQIVEVTGRMDWLNNLCCGFQPVQVLGTGSLAEQAGQKQLIFLEAREPDTVREKCKRLRGMRPQKNPNQLTINAMT